MNLESKQTITAKKQRFLIEQGWKKLFKHYEHVSWFLYKEYLARWKHEFLYGPLIRSLFVDEIFFPKVLSSKHNKTVITVSKAQFDAIFKS